MAATKRVLSRKQQISFGERNKADLLSIYRSGNEMLAHEFGLDLERYGYH